MGRRKVFAVLAVMFAGVLSTASAEPEERRGCCSHHQGVCGCEGGSVKCCDGGLSPSCTC